MKPRVYVETTVISYLTARPSRHLVIAARQEVTRAVWNRLLSDCECFVAALAVLDASKGDQVVAAQRLDVVRGLPVLHVGDDAGQTAEYLVAERVISAEYAEDALHVATAVLNGMDVVVPGTSPTSLTPPPSTRYGRSSSRTSSSAPNCAHRKRSLESCNDRPNRWRSAEVSR